MSIKNVRNILIVIFCVISAEMLMGQSFSVVSYSSNPSDLSARTESRTDLNGVKCGLVKVRCVLDGVTFKGNVIGDVQLRDGEYWVYMSNGSKKLSVFHPKLLPIDIDLESLCNETVNSSSTYILTLSIPEVLYTSTLSRNDTVSNHNVVNNTLSEEYNNYTLYGIIVDEEDGEPLIGCTARIKDTPLDVWSDHEGTFTIVNVPEKSTLEISYIGYKKKEITFTGKIPPKLNISLKYGKGVEREEFYYDPNDKSEYFDLKGNALPSRPTKKGTYLRVSDGKPEKFTIK